MNLNGELIGLIAAIAYAALAEYLAHNPNIAANSPLQLLKSVLKALAGK